MVNTGGLASSELKKQQGETSMWALQHECHSGSESLTDGPQPTKVAILSLLFNWPSTGGGTVHTAELGTFLQREGYDVRHIYAHYADWEVGNVTQPLEHELEELEFDKASWNETEIKTRFRHALDQFQPDFVIITDSWNTKPLLCEAAIGYRYFLRLAALECLCPLNNVRLRVSTGGYFENCSRHQLATPHACQECVLRQEKYSGSLHRAERGLAGYDRTDYHSRLIQAFAKAEAVLAVNPLIAAMVGPYCRDVRVVPSGFDEKRFEGLDNLQPLSAADGKTRILFAGLTDEPMKGFSVLLAACKELWEKRNDFELWATGNDGVCPDSEEELPFLKLIGWQSQADLPQRLRDVDLLAFPTIAEEALGRSAVEAMGAGRPVIASRIGGLSFTVSDGATGLLFDPGNAGDLATKLEQLLDDPVLRQRMGQAGRHKFESEFCWRAVIDNHYHNLFGSPVITP